MDCRGLSDCYFNIFLGYVGFIVRTYQADCPREFSSPGFFWATYPSCLRDNSVASCSLRELEAVGCKGALATSGDQKERVAMGYSRSRGRTGRKASHRCAA